MREKILQVKTFGSFPMIYDGKYLFGRKVRRDTVRFHDADADT